VRRLSTIFLICFVALVGGLGGAIAWKKMGRRPPPPVAVPPAQADYQIKEIHINETLEGNLRWTLDADQAEVFDKDQRTDMKKVVIKVFTKDSTWTVTGDQGTLDNQKRDVSIQGNVVVSSSDGLTLKTNELGWRNADRNLFSDAGVQIERAGTTITGRGFDVRMAEERAVLQKNVRVVITDRNRANLSFFPRSGS
jgi:LPS export ABC transporter protein LptC